MRPAIAAEQSATLLGGVRRHQWRIGFTYLLTLAENVFELLYPFAIGLAIDGLLAGEGMVSLAPLVLIWLAHIATGAARQLYDTRLFTTLYGEVAATMIERQRAAGAAIGEVAARSTMARDATDFFEIEVPALITDAIGLFGGIAMLWLYDGVAAAIMMAVLVPVACLQVVYGRRAYALTVRLNDRHEREVDAVADGRGLRLRAHFRALARWRVMLSDAQVRAWTWTEFLALGALLFVLLRVTAGPDTEAGAIFAALAYALLVLDALDDAPIVVEQLARLVDIRRRLDPSPTNGS